MQNNFNISIFTTETLNMMKKIINSVAIVFAFIFIFLTFAWGKSDFLGINSEKRIGVVVIDPGHGGKDFGTTMGNTHEKDVVLDISLRLGELIKKNYPEIKIIYTRSKDIFIPLFERANIANKNKADLFISIHANGTENKGVQGTETFVLGQHRNIENLEVAKKENSVILLEDNYNTRYEGFDPNSSESYIMFELVQDEYLEQSVMFASEIQQQFRQYAKRADRSVKQAGFLVLRQTTMPSVLIEVGFISHSGERSYLASEKGKSTLSLAIFNAFKDYKQKTEETSSFTVNVNSESSTIEELAIKKISEQKHVQKNTTSASEKVIKAGPEGIYFSVQIAASTKKIDTSPYNFKGEKNIYRIESKNINRYFSGKFVNYNDAVLEKKRIERKYPESFVVAIQNNELISVKKALGKM